MREILWKLRRYQKEKVLRILCFLGWVKVFWKGENNVFLNNRLDRKTHYLSLLCFYTEKMLKKGKIIVYIFSF